MKNLTVSDRRADGQRTDGRIDKVGYRGACYAPKNDIIDYGEQQLVR